MDLLHPLTIGNVTLPNNLVLSPMAGFSDLPFRVLCRRHGAGLVCSEMVAAAAVGREPERPMMRRKTAEEERPTSIQIFGTEPDEVANAAHDLGKNCDILGFNMGCPAPQIKRQGCGAALLDHPERCVELVEAVKGASPKPLLVKIRAGNRGRIDVGAFARRLEHAGADAFIFHARTADQGYSGKSDWDLVREVKNKVSVPVIGNGDVVDGPSARGALERSGADGVAIGRASLGDPRVFARIARFLRDGEKSLRPTPREKSEDFLAYLDMAAPLGFDHARILQQAQRFTRHLSGGSDFRSRLQGRRTSVPEIRAFFEGLAAAG